MYANSSGGPGRRARRLLEEDPRPLPRPRGGVQSARNQNSITHRWSTIQDSVGRFERCLARVDGAGQDGVITQDEVSLKF